MITVSRLLFTSLAIHVTTKEVVDAVSFNNHHHHHQGITPSHVSLSRVVNESQRYNGLGRSVSSTAALNISGGSVGSVGGGSGTVTLTSVDHNESDELNDSTPFDSTPLPKDNQQQQQQQEQQEEESNDSRNEIIRGGDTTGALAVMKKHPQHHTKVKPSFTGTASVVQKNKLGRIKAKTNKSHLTIAKQLKNRNTMNLKRKGFHAGVGLFFATMNQLLPKTIFVPGMSLLTSSILAMELLRYKPRFSFLNRALHFCLGGALRKQEMEGKFTGAFYYFCGVTVTSALFPTSCASLGICQLALADPSASFFGRQTRHVYWSRIEKGFFGLGRNKGILGFLGGALVCFPFNYKLLSIAKFGASATGVIPGGQRNVALASLALGVTGAFADLCVPTPALTMPNKVCGVEMPPFHVDDNVVVPILSGFACTKIFQVLGWTQGVELAKFLIR